MSRNLQQRLFQFGVIRWALALAFLARGALFFAIGNQYRGVSDFCWIVRVSHTGLPRRIARRAILRVLADMRSTGRNTLAASFRQNRASAVSASMFSLSGVGRRDLFRDVIVLKRASANERGVLLLKYAKTFDALFALFDVSRLMERYIIVLEPCWAGYWDPSILMFAAERAPVVVQCFTDEDSSCIEEIGAPFVPVRLGPADWVDGSLFRPASVEKAYDLVMVANWAAHKRHALLLRALAQIEDRPLKVLFIGFPWGNRTADDIRREAAPALARGVTLDIVESIPASEVATYVSRCKVFVFLSRKEGDNKALVEAMFADVPSIVYKDTVGGARSRINSETGILAGEDELADKIRYMLDRYRDFTPRRWVEAHSGSVTATRVLDEAIRTAARAAGEACDDAIVEKMNAPNLAYRNADDRQRFRADYDHVLECRREQPVRAAHEAVALRERGAGRGI